MASFLQVNNHLESSSNSFQTDETASICPLITPSPPTNDLINPTESNETNYTIGDDLATMLQRVRDDGAGDSASSSSSALAEPSCTQLLNHRNNTYHHINKDEITNFNEETSGKVQPMQLTFKNPPENYFFMSWNWPIIRKVCTWLYIAVLVAMSASVVSMIMALPKTCNPEVEWYQGSVFYEVFPASFFDSNNDMIGDLKGISQQSDYFAKLGVKAIRLNSIFNTQHYPEDYKNTTTLMQIASVLGTIEDFKIMVRHLDSRNISLILDLPLHPTVNQLSNQLSKKPDGASHNSTDFIPPKILDSVDEALLFWCSQGVAGFYLKGLEHFLEDVNFVAAIRRWKKIIGPNRIFMVHNIVIESSSPKLLNTLLSNIHLVDVRLEIEKGLEEVHRQIDNVQNGTLFKNPGLPWLHWNLGDDSITRLANSLSHDNATLGATLLQFMLPGTVSIFYGNEIGLKQTPDVKGERQDLKHLHQLAMMAFKKRKPVPILSWMPADTSHVNFDQIDIVSDLIKLRNKSPAIYISSVYKEGVNKVNSEVKYAKDDLLLIQRWYPRRKSFVVASNLGQKQITADLSTLLYSGLVEIGPRADSNPGSISFKNISLWPGESVVILLD